MGIGVGCLPPISCNAVEHTIGVKGRCKHTRYTPTYANIKRAILHVPYLIPLRLSHHPQPSQYRHCRLRSGFLLHLLLLLGILNRQSVSADVATVAHVCHGRAHVGVEYVDRDQAHCDAITSICSALPLKVHN